MIDLKQLSESEVRQRLINAHTAFRHELATVSVEFSQLMLSYHEVCQKPGKLGLARMMSKRTALDERTTWLTANIEFIEQIGVFDQSKRSIRMKDELQRRHSGLARSVTTSLADTLGTISRAQKVVAQAIDTRQVIGLGEKVRHQVGSDHAKLMKDLAIVGFIQQFGVTSSWASKSDL